MGGRFRYLILALFALGFQVASAQPEGGGDAGGDKDPVFEAGFHLGNLLPNQITGVTEIMGLGGIRMGYRLNPGSYFETGFITGNGKGQQWKDIHADIRMDIPIENLLASAFIGADNYYYKGRGTGQKLVFGGHAGGAIQAHLSGATWFRTDMRFGFGPGTTLYFGFGFVWRL